MFIVHEWTTSDVTSGEFTTFSFGAGTTILRHFNMNNNINTSFYIAIAKRSVGIAKRSVGIAKHSIA